MCDDKLVHGNIALSNYTEDAFTKYMMSMFTNLNVYDNSKMKSINGKGTSCAHVATECQQPPSSDLLISMDVFFVSIAQAMVLPVLLSCI